MSLLHDIIKIKYTRLGYLPNYPYHLISDEEMFDAFIDLNAADDSGSGEVSNTERFFEDTYPDPFQDEDVEYESPSGEIISLRAEYFRLKEYIIDAINEYLQHQGTPEEENYELPAWVYTYMLGEVIYNSSEYQDIYDLLVLLNSTNIDNEMTRFDCKKCYEKSTKYISTLTSGVRPPTVFGEPHVIKQLRLEA